MPFASIASPFVQTVSKANPFLTVVEAIAEYYAFSALEAKLFPVLGPQVADRHIVGIDDGSNLDLVFNEVRCDAGVVDGDPLRVYTKAGNVSVNFVANCGYAPLIAQGAMTGAQLLKVWFGTINGATRLHYDSTRSFNFDAPEFIYGGNQTKANAWRASVAAAAGEFCPIYPNQLIVGWKRLHTPKYGNQVPQAQSYLWQAGNGDLADIVLSLLSLRGIDPPNVDASDLIGVTVTGCRFRTPVGIADAVQQLCDFYAVDVFVSNGKIKFRQRLPDRIDGSIAWGDIGTIVTKQAGDEPKTRGPEVLAYPQDTPGTALITFKNSADNHQPGFLPVVLDESSSTEPENIDLDIAATVDEIQAFGLRHLDELRQAQRTFQFSLPHTYAGLELADVYTYPLDPNGDETVLIRIRKKSEEDPITGTFTVEAYAISTRPINTTAAGTGGGSSSGTGGEIGPVYAVVWSPGEDTGEPEAYPNDPSALVPSVCMIPWWALGLNDNGWQSYWRIHASGSAWTEGPNGLLRYPIGLTASVFPNATAALDFETRALSIVLQGELDTDDLLSTTHDLIVNGISSGVDTSNLSLVEQELCAFTSASRTSSAHWSLSDWYGGINGTPFTGHTSPVRFAKIPPQGDLPRILFDPSMVGQQVDIAIIAPGDTITTFYTVTIGKPGANAVAPDFISVSGPIPWHRTVYRLCQAQFSVDVSKIGLTYKWETNLSGAGWVVQETVGDQILVAWGPTDDMQVRVTAFGSNGSKAGPVSTADLPYIEPHVLGLLNPITVVDTVTDYEGSGWTLSGNVLTAPSNGALFSIDGFNSWSVGSSGVFPSSVLINKPGGHKWNGPWNVVQIGDASHPAKLSRQGQAQQVTDFIKQQLVGIQEGTVLPGEGTIWRCKTAPATTINVDPIEYEKIGGPGVVTDPSSLAGVALAWDSGTDKLDVQVDNSTVKVNGSNELYVAASAPPTEFYFFGDGSTTSFDLGAAATVIQFHYNGVAAGLTATISAGLGASPLGFTYDYNSGTHHVSMKRNNVAFTPPVGSVIHGWFW